MEKVTQLQLNDWENDWDNPAFYHPFNFKWVWKMAPDSPVYGCGWVWLLFFEVHENKSKEAE